MGLIQKIKLKFKPNYEVKAENFYSKFLNQEDAQNLRPFISNFGDKLSVSSAILAVGSSVFPLEFWNYRKKLNAKNPDLSASETYGDIDLLVVPQNKVPLNKLESAVQEALSQLGFSYKSHEMTTAGVAYCKGCICGDGEKPKNAIIPYLHMDYGLHSIETNMRNGRKLDLILGRDDLLEQTASLKLAEERKEKCAFSLLYWKHL